MALACGGGQGTARAPTAPEHAAPGAELPLPSGLDVAVRVDLVSLAAELGAAPARRLLLDAVSLEAAPSPSPLLERALARSSLLWWGLAAPGASAPTQRVLVLRGHFDAWPGTASTDARWSRHASGVEALEVAEAGYARAYRLPERELLVWTPGPPPPSVESAPSEPGMHPPERGAISVAARPARVLERLRPRFPELSERFRGVRQIEAFAEPTAGTWRADLTLEFESPAQAADASTVLEQLRQALAGRPCAVGVVARAIAVTSFERDVRVQTVLIGPELEALQACVLGGGCCA